MCDYYIVEGQDPEYLTAESVEEAVNEYIESPDFFHAQNTNTLPAIISVQGYKKMALSKDDPSFTYAFEQLMESIDEELNPQGEIEQPSEIEVAYKAFVKTFVDKYSVWSCEPHGETIPVSLKEYFKKGDS